MKLPLKMISLKIYTFFLLCSHYLSNFHVLEAAIYFLKKAAYSIKKMFLEISQNSQENTCAGISLLIKLQAEHCNFIKKEILTQVFSSELWEFFKKTFFTEQFWVTASYVYSHKE